MTYSLLEQFLISQLFTVLLVFVRVGAGIMLLPGIGESYVAIRVRLLLALGISVVMTPLLMSDMPPVPDDPLTLTVLLFGEMLAGLAIGMVCRYLIVIMHVTGMIISYQAGLAMAVQFDPNQASQGSVIGNFLSLSAVVLLFIFDLHYVMLRGLADSYTLFAPGKMPPIEDFITYFSQLASDTFTVALQLAAPSLVVGLLVNLCAGILTRVMPNMQVFFVLMPVQIVTNFFLFAAVLASVLLYFTDYFRETLVTFLEAS